MVLGNVAAVLHNPPVYPRTGRIGTKAPDLLAIDDILEVNGRTLVHDPFSNVDTRQCGHLSRSSVSHSHTGNAVLTLPSSAII